MKRYKTELALQQDIIARFAYYGVTAVHIPGGGASYAHRRKMAIAGYIAGFPDIVVLARGRHVGFAEIKLPGGRLSDSQIRWSEVFKEFAIDYAVLNSPHDVETTLLRWGWL